MRALLRTLAFVASVAVVPTLAAQAKPAKTAPAAAAAKPAAAPAAPAAATTAQVDINKATAAELEAIPGIGKSYAAKIIAGRPYANKLQLVQKKVLTQAVYDKVKDLIIAKQ
jgi:DNA uptake protein ComE-like DNA-binding protein